MVQRGVLSVDDASLSARLAEQPPIPNHAMGPIPNQQRFEGVEGRGGHDWPTRRDLETLPGPNVPVVPRLWGWTWDAVKHDRTRLLRCGRCAGATSCFEGHSKKVTLCGLQSFLAHTGPLRYLFTTRVLPCWPSTVVGSCPRDHRASGTRLGTLSSLRVVTRRSRHLIHDSQHGAPSVLPPMRSPCELCP
jgi:hypothetical protein